MTIEQVRFVEVYNDILKHPTLTDVALELGLSYQTVRNRSCVLRGRFRRGEDVPELISRVVQAKPRDAEAPVNHANRRADLLRDEVHTLLTGSRYPVINPEAIVVDSNVARKYDRLTGTSVNQEGTPRTWLSDTLKVERIDDPRGRVFIFTGAQNDAEIDHAFWANLQAYAAFRDADIVVGPGTYETQWWAENNPSVRQYDADIRDYLCFGQMEIGEFVFCGEMNMLPTANRPISDLTTYSQNRWAVFPHAKLQLKSVPSTNPNIQAHQVMTTGLVTRPKVIPRKAGIKSIFHHVIGATIVEFDADGDIFCRQLNAANDGSFYDLEVFVTDGQVELHTDGIELMTCGDIHLRKLDQRNSLSTFGFDFKSGKVAHKLDDVMLAALKPGRVVVHDIFDNESRNHHHVHDNAYSYTTAITGRDDVLGEIADVSGFLRQLAVHVAVTVVESNHDIALERYIREGRYRNDGLNIRLGLQLEDAYLSWREQSAFDIEDNIDPSSFSLLQYAIDTVATKAGYEHTHVEWVHDGKSHVVNGIESGHHGFRGANGARGTVAGFAQLGRKMTIADKHSPEICDGVYVAGCMNLHHGYNKGPSGWAIAHVLQYSNGKRTLVTMQNGKWRGNW